MYRTRRRRLIPGRKVYRRRRFMRRRGYPKSKVVDHLAVYHNAFSTRTTNPKIPDGKAYASSGIRLQAVKEFVNDSDGVMDFLLFPGINNGLIAASTNDGAASWGMPYTSHCVLDEDSKQSEDSMISRWRIVSQAMKVNLTNNSDENDGWWEAIRVQLNPAFNPDTGNDGFVIALHDDGRNVIGPAIGGQIPGMDLATPNLVEHPTYTTGKLRDIHRHMFDLMPQGNDHDFNDCPKQFVGGAAIEKAIDWKNYDAIFLRIHGRAGSSTPTRVMIHVVSNQELVYQESTALSRYHSESDNHAAVFQRSKRKRQNGDHRAAKRSRVVAIA